MNKRKIIFLIVIFILIVVSNCLEMETRDWAIYKYIAGDNDLDSYHMGNGVYGSFFQMNAEMLTEADDNIHVVIFYDRWSGEFEYGTDNSWWSTPVPRPEEKTGMVIYYVEDGELIDITEQFSFETGQLIDSGNAQNLEKFILGALELFPARQIHLDLGSHGAGIDGVNTDYTSGTIMNLGNEETNSFSAVIGKVFGRLAGRILEKNPDLKLNVVAFDACLMGMSEINYELSRHNVEFVVSSQQVIPGAGFPYDKMVNNMANRNPLRHTSNLVEDYVKLYRNSDGGSYGGFNLASINTDRILMDEYANSIGEVFGILVEQYNNLITSAKKDTMEQFHNIVIDTFKYPDMSRGNFIDIIALLKGMNENNRLNKLIGEDIINNAIEKSKRVISINRNTFRSTTKFKEDTHGMSIYFMPYRRGSNYSNFTPQSYETRLKNYSLSNTKMYTELSRFHDLYFKSMEELENL